MTVLPLAGLAVLLLGGDLLVRGAASLAESRGVPPLIVGLTVVSFGTSAPEVAVSARGALQNASNIAVGNVFGSNMFNVLAILGALPVLTPLVVKAELVRRDVPVMILAYFAACAAFLVLDGTGHQAVPVLAGIMLAFVLPLTVVFSSSVPYLTRRWMRIRSRGPPSGVRRPEAGSVPGRLVRLVGFESMIGPSYEDSTMAPIAFTVNGTGREVDVPPDTPLLWVIRDHLQLTGTKYGCGIAQCGSCTVHLDGEPLRSCSVPVSAAEGKRVTTIEGLAADDRLHPLQEAWIAEEVPQCGYCQAGQIMSAAALLARTPNPSDQEIDQAMAGNICRCGTYLRIRSAVKRAAQEVTDER